MEILLSKRFNVKGRSSVKWKQIKEGSKQFRKRDENDLFSFFFFSPEWWAPPKAIIWRFFPENGPVQIHKNKSDWSGRWK